MQPERRIAIALTGLGAAMVLPHAAPALRGDPALLARGAGALLLGNLLGGAGLFLLTLMLLASDHPRGFRILMACGLVPCALAWIAVGPLLAWHGHVAAALSSLAPAAGFAGGLYGALKR